MACHFPDDMLRAVARVDAGMASVVHRGRKEIPVLAASLRVMLNNDGATVNLQDAGDYVNGRNIRRILVSTRYARTVCAMAMWSIQAQAATSGLRMWGSGFTKEGSAAMAAAETVPLHRRRDTCMERELLLARVVKKIIPRIATE